MINIKIKNDIEAIINNFTRNEKPNNARLEYDLIDDNKKMRWTYYIWNKNSSCYAIMILILSNIEDDLIKVVSYEIETFDDTKWPLYEEEILITIDDFYKSDKFYKILSYLYKKIVNDLP